MAEWTGEAVATACVHGVHCGFWRFFAPEGSVGGKKVEAGKLEFRPSLLLVQAVEFQHGERLLPERNSALVVTFFFLFLLADVTAVAEAHSCQQLQQLSCFIVGKHELKAFKAVAACPLAAQLVRQETPQDTPTQPLYVQHHQVLLACSRLHKHHLEEV